MGYFNILFTKRDGNVFAAGIRLALGTKYNHVAIEICEDGHKEIYQASVFGITETSEYEFLRKNKIVFKKMFEASKDKLAQVRDFCKRMLGKPYSWISIISIFLQLTFKIRNYIAKDGTRTLMCSEFAARALKIVVPFKSDEIDTMDPKELYVLTRSIS